MNARVLLDMHLNLCVVDDVISLIMRCNSTNSTSARACQQAAPCASSTVNPEPCSLDPKPQTLTHVSSGGAMRFINHCLQDFQPNVRACVLNHYGVAHVALYATRPIELGGELSLRYREVSDAEFFASPCGLD